MLALAGLGVILLGGVLALVAFSGGGESSTVIGSRYCTEKSYPGLQPEHRGTPEAKVDYNSFPPSSGPHYSQWAPWGWYDDPIRQTIPVHNLEHGGIVVQYGRDVSEDDIRKLQSFFQDDPNGLVVAPLPRLGNKFALTAWNAPPYDRTEEDVKEVDAGNGYVMTCTRFDGDAFAEFRDERRGKGGERFPVSELTPGTQ